MRVLRHFVVIVAAIGALPTVLRAQDQVPKELALALIPYGATEGGEIIIGQVPPDLATTFTLPAGGRVLGSFVSLNYMQIVLSFPGSPDSAQAFARQALLSHGWAVRERMPQMGGLQYGPRTSIPTTFCKTGGPDAMSVTTQFHGTGTTLLHLTRTMGSSLCDQDSGGLAAFSSSSGALMPAVRNSQLYQFPLATLPPLWSPGDFRISSQRCQPQRQGGMGPQSQEQPLLTDMSANAILDHYGRQLDSAGWKAATGAGEMVSRTWSKEISGRGTQDVTITVSRLPTQPGCYGVNLRASALPR
jgi:hypothetical protein